MGIWFDVIYSFAGLAICIYMLLAAYRIVPLNIKDPEKAELWHRKFDKIMKIAAVLGIIGFIFIWLGNFISYFEGK